MRRVAPRCWIFLFSLLGCDLRDPVRGELYIEQEQPPGRALVYAPSDCADGDPFGFFGVQMKDDKDRILEFFRDGEHPALLYYEPGGDAFELGPADCEFFEGSLTREFNRVTGNGRVHGDLAIACTTADGLRIEGDLEFERCDNYADDDDDWDDDWDDDDFWDDD